MIPVFGSIIQNANNATALAELRDIKLKVQTEVLPDNVWEFEDGNGNTITIHQNIDGTLWAEGAANLADALNSCPDLDGYGSFKVSDKNIIYTTKNGNGKTTWSNIVGEGTIAPSTPSEGLVFRPINNDTEYEVSYIGTCTDEIIIIPATYNGKPVTKIGDSAFMMCPQIKSVVIPNTVISIGYKAFWECTGLTSVTIPDSVTSIGGVAFYNCTSLKIELPDSIIEIGSQALENVTIVELILSPNATMDSKVFRQCTVLNGITVDPQNEKYVSVGNCLIDKKSKTLVLGCNNSTIPTDGSVTSIAAYAFYNCDKLTSITIPESVTSIADSAFAGCSGLTSITVDSKNTKYASVNNCLIDKENYTLISGCKNSIIPNDGSVKTIAAFAFYGCTDLTSLYIPKTVESIKNQVGVFKAFYGCSNLTSITVDPQNAKYTSTGNCLVDKTTKTLVLGCKDSVIPTDGSVTIIGSGAFAGNAKLTGITIPEQIVEIKRDAFTDCTALQNIIIPDTVTKISSWNMFSGCTSLTSIVLPNSVGDTALGTFSYCSNLTSVVLPDTLKNISTYTFMECTSLTSITIPHGVEKITEYAFAGCTNLTRVVIPKSVTAIGLYTFYTCPNMETITYLGTVEEWNAIGKSDGIWIDANYNFTIYCVDGTIASDGTVTYY